MQSAKVKSHQKDIDTKRILIEAEGDFLTRDLVNTPTNDMGPDALEKAFCDLAKKHNATTNIIRGESLIRPKFSNDTCRWPSI